MKKGLLISVFISLFFIAHNSQSHNPEGVFIVHMNEDGFYPSELTVPKGDTVIFENTDTRDRWPASNIHPTHGIYPEFDPKEAISPGEEWQFKFTKTGSWKYHDHLNPKITGTVAVNSETTETDGQNKTSQSFFQRLLSPFKYIFEKILSLLKKKGISGKPEDHFAPIAKDSKDIFNNEGPLKNYIHEYGPKQTTQQLNILSPEFGSCHDPAHKAGRISYELLGEKAFKECGAECHSGCYHGATEAYFKDHGTANLSKNLNTLCGNELNGFFSHQCIHGIGHGLMAWANYDIFEALKSCDLLDKRQDSCWTGVFMENFVGGLADKKDATGHFTKYLSNDPQYPCTIVDDKYKGSCYFLQTSRMIQIFGSNFEKVAKACLDAPKQYQRECFLSMGRDVGGVFRKNAPEAIKACLTAPEGEYRVDCLDGAIQDTFWDSSGQDDAIGFCKLLTDKEQKAYCYNLIFQRVPQVLTSKEEIKTFCAKAEKEYQQLCPK